MATGAVRVRGLQQLTTDFRKMSKDIAKDVNMELEEAGEPVRKSSEQYVDVGGGGFREMVNMESPYNKFRIGVGKGLVYVAPAWKRTGTGTPRPMLTEHVRPRMEKALEDNEEEVVRILEGVIDTLGHLYDFY